MKKKKWKILINLLQTHTHTHTHTKLHQPTATLEQSTHNSFGDKVN